MSNLMIAKFLPVPSLREVDHVAVAAAPGKAWPAARAVDLARMPFVRFLFEARVLPDRARALLRGLEQPALESIGVESVEKSEGPGFMILGEEPGREVVVGAVGRFWKPRIEWADITPDQFAGFAQPGWGKVAWCIRVDPREAGGSWITFEVRVGATDAASLGKFKPYWRLIGRFSRAIRRSALKRVARELGEAPLAPVAGGDLLKEARFDRTHHQFIEAPPDRVWPWLAQMGCRRAGWYSYDFLDNGGVKSANRILPEAQKLAVGDILPATPKDTGGFAVLQMDRGRSLVLGSPRLLPNGGPAGLAWGPYDATWAFQLEPIGTDATNLVVQVRAQFEPSLRSEMTRLVVGTAHQIMQPEQLRNLKARVEKGARA